MFDTDHFITALRLHRLNGTLPLRLGMAICKDRRPGGASIAAPKLLPPPKCPISPRARIPQKRQRALAIQPIVDELIAVAPQAAVAA